MRELHEWLKAPVCLLLGLSLGSLSCGDDADDGLGAFCTDVAPCGGDPTGTWEGAAFCADFTSLAEAQGLPAGCERSLLVENVTLDTTLIISSTDWAENGNIIVDWRFNFDSTCVAAYTEQALDDVGTFCDLFPSAIQGTEGNIFEDLSCAVSDDTCRCTAVQRAAVDTATAITVEGNNIVEANGQTSGFCQTGDQLSVQADVPMVGSVAVVYTRAP